MLALGTVTGTSAASMGGNRSHHLLPVQSLALWCCVALAGLQRAEGFGPKPPANNSADNSAVLLWGPGVSSTAPRVALRGIHIDSSPAASVEPALIWENLGEIPRAVEAVSGSQTDDADAVDGASFFADTEGSIMMLEPGVQVHTLVPRTPGTSVEHSVLSLAHRCRKSGEECRLYFTVNTTIRYLPVATDGRSATGPAVTIAQFTPRGVQSLVVDWATDTAYFCLFDGANRTSGSLVSAPLDDPTTPTVLVNQSLSTLNGAPFGDALPRLALDTKARKLFFAVFALGISWIDLDDPGARPQRLPMRDGNRGNPPVYLSLAVLPPPPTAASNVNVTSGTRDGAQPQQQKATLQLIFASIYGDIGVVPSDGGDITWLSRACAPAGGCRYRQLWDMKVVMPPSTKAAPHRKASVLAAWIRVTNLDGSRATVQTASVYRLELAAGPLGNWTGVVPTSLYTTDRMGGVGLTVLPAHATGTNAGEAEAGPSNGNVDPGCTGYYIQNGYSSIYRAPMAGIKPVTQFAVPQYQFNSGLALDTQRRRAFWYQQLLDPNVAGNNGYGIQLMSAGVDDLKGGASILSSLCHQHEGSLFVDPASGDVIFQSYGGSYATATGVKHYCYRSSANPKPRLFFVQSGGVSVAVDWQTRAMYVSGSSYRSRSTISRVSIDAKDPAANPKVVVAQNTSAVAVAVAGGSLFYVMQSVYGQRKFQNYTLYSCTPPAVGATGASACDATNAKDLGPVDRAFADQFSSIAFVASAPDGSSLFVSAERGNSIAKVYSTYHVATHTWTPVYITPFDNPIAIGGDPSRLSFVDGSTSAFGSFAPVRGPDSELSDSFNVPFHIAGHFKPLSHVPCGSPCPAGASGAWGTSFISGASKWFWLSITGSSGNDVTFSLFQAALTGEPDAKQALELAPNASSGLLAVDEAAGEAYYVVNVPTRVLGPPASPPCNTYGSMSGAQNLVRASFDSDAPAAGSKPPTVVLALPNGVCFGATVPALDAAGGKLYYSELQRYSTFQSTPFLAVLDLATGIKRRINVAGLTSRSVPSFKNLQLSDDGSTLWSWACFQGSNGCDYRLVAVGNITADPNDARFMTATYWGTTIPGLSATDRLSSLGLQDYSIRKQHNSTSFVFVAFHSGQASGRPIRGVYEGNAVPGGIATIKSLLQPIDVKAVDIDHTDAEHGMLVAPLPPDNTVVPVARPLNGLLLLRGPTAGVGMPNGKTMAPKMIPWPAELPAELRDPNIVQLAHRPPHGLLFTYGRYNCIADEIWAVDLADDATACPTQLVSALMKPFSNALQSRPAVGGGLQLSWTKCASRLVFADIPASTAVGDALDYASLDFAWLDIPVPGRPSISSFARVGDTFIFIYSTKSVIYSAVLVPKRNAFEHVTLLSNDSSWLPLSTTVHGSTVFIGERNATAYSSYNTNGRIRSIDLSTPTPTAAAKLKVFVRDTVGVDDLSTMPAACLPSTL